MATYRLINNTQSSLPLADSVTLPPGGERTVGQITREMRRLEQQQLLSIFETLEASWDNVLRPDYVNAIDPLTSTRSDVWILGEIAAAGGGGGGGGSGGSGTGDLAALLPAPDGSVPEYQNVGDRWTATNTPRALLLDGGNF